MIAIQVRSSSSGEIYSIVAAQNGERLMLSCSCKAGAVGDVCKHRLAVLDGVVGDIVEGVEAIDSLRSLIQASQIAPALAELRSAELELAAAKGRLSRAKKALAWSFNG